MTTTPARPDLQGLHDGDDPPSHLYVEAATAWRRSCGQTEHLAEAAEDDLAHCAGLRAAVDTVWADRTPTLWAYLAACRAVDKHRATLRQIRMLAEQHPDQGLARQILLTLDAGDA